MPSERVDTPLETLERLPRIADLRAAESTAFTAMVRADDRDDDYEAVDDAFRKAEGVRKYAEAAWAEAGPALVERIRKAEAKAAADELTIEVLGGLHSLGAWDRYDGAYCDDGDSRVFAEWADSSTVDISLFLGDDEDPITTENVGAEDIGATILKLEETARASLCEAKEPTEAEKVAACASLTNALIDAGVSLLDAAGLTEEGETGA